MTPANVRAFAADQSGYPVRLAAAKGRPAHLYVRGELGPLEQVVTIVGARAATAEGRLVARELAAGLGALGWVVMSGGALGIDTAAHRGALEAGAKTVVVLGSGIDVPYPARNRELFDRIAASGGAVVSPFAIGTAPRAGCFVARNHHMAAMSDVVVVVEAGAASGALHTARHAARLGRVVGAVPGSLGCQALIAQGAAVIESSDDVLDAVRGRPKPPGVELPDADSDCGRVLALLDEAGRSIDELGVRCGMPGRKITRALTELELDGLVVALPGRRYARSALAGQRGVFAVVQRG